MKITDVRIRKITREGKMKAIVSVTFDNEFVVHDIKIIDGQNGLFVAMPSRQIADGEFRDIAHPINAETRKKIQDAIFAEYERALELQEERDLELQEEDEELQEEDGEDEELQEEESEEELEEESEEEDHEESEVDEELQGESLENIL